jgi:hypothetical protein
MNRHRAHHTPRQRSKMFSTTTAVGQTGKKIDTGIILLHDYYRRQEVAHRFNVLV